MTDTDAHSHTPEERIYLIGLEMASALSLHGTRRGLNPSETIAAVIVALPALLDSSVTPANKATARYDETLKAVCDAIMDHAETFRADGVTTKQ